MLHIVNLLLRILNFAQISYNGRDVDLAPDTKEQLKKTETTTFLFLKVFKINKIKFMKII